MPYPNFIIGGPPKCGTTSLFSWLTDHPEVCTSSVKETYHFYSRTEDKTGEVETFSDEHIQAYHQYFEHCDSKKIICEATPSYLYSESAIHGLKAVNPNMKFLFVYREPAERLYSEYSFHRYKTKRFAGTFQSYVTDLQLAQSNYFLYLNRWIEAFDRSNIAILRFNDLRNHPNLSMKAVCEFLNINSSHFDDLQLEAKNPTAAMRSRWIHVQLLRLMNMIPKGMVKVLSPIYYRLNAKEAPSRTSEEQAYYETLKSKFETDHKKLDIEFSDCILKLDQKVS